MSHLVVIEKGLPKEDLLKSSFKSALAIKSVDFTESYESVIEGVDLTKVTHVAFVYHSQGPAYVPFFQVEEDPSLGLVDASGEPIDSTEPFNANMIKFMQKVKEQSNDCVFDLLSCDMNTDRFKSAVEEVQDELGVNIRYSLDATGNPSYGNWVLESDNVEVRSLYFNDTIEQWDTVLGVYTPANLPGLILDGDTYKLTQDIVFTTHYAVFHLGSSSGAYSFDGQGHKIIYQNVTSRRTGLFYSAGMENALIKNLTIVGTNNTSSYGDWSHTHGVIMFTESVITKSITLQNVSFIRCRTMSNSVGLVNDAKQKSLNSDNAKLICKNIRIRNSSKNIVSRYLFPHTGYSNRRIIIDGVLITNPIGSDGMVGAHLVKNNGDKIIVKNVIMKSLPSNQRLVDRNALTFYQGGEFIFENIVCADTTHCIRSGLDPADGASNKIVAQSVSITNFINMQTEGDFDSRPFRSTDDAVQTFTNVQRTDYVDGSADATGLVDDSVLTTGWTDLGNGGFKMVASMSEYPFNLTSYDNLHQKTLSYPPDNSALLGGLQAAGVADVSIYNIDALAADGLELSLQLVGDEFTTFATKAAVRHAALDFMFALSSGVSNFISEPSKLGLVSDKSQVVAYKSGGTVDTDSLPTSQAAYINLSSENDTTTITANGNSSTITRNASNQYVVSGDVITGTYDAEQTALLPNGAIITFGGLMIEGPGLSYKFYGDNGTNGAGFYYPVYEVVAPGTESVYTQHTLTGYDGSGVTFYIPTSGGVLASNTDNASLEYHPKSGRDATGLTNWEPSDLVGGNQSDFVWVDIMDLMTLSNGRKVMKTQGAGTFVGLQSYVKDNDEKLIKGKQHTHECAEFQAPNFGRDYVISEVVRLDSAYNNGWMSQNGFFYSFAGATKYLEFKAFSTGWKPFKYNITDLVDDKMHLVTIVSKTNETFKVYIDGVLLDPNTSTKNNTNNSANYKYFNYGNSKVAWAGEFYGDYLAVKGTITEEERLLMESYLGYKFSLQSVIDNNPYQVSYNVVRGNVLGVALASAEQGLTDAGLSNKNTLDTVNTTNKITSSLFSVLGNKVQQRLRRHASLKYLFLSQKTKFIRSTPAAIGLDTTEKATVNVHAAGEAISLTNLPTDEAVYANLSDAGDSTTITLDASSVIVTKNAEGGYDVSGDIFQGTFQDGDATYKKGYSFTFGGVTVDDSTSASQGDPHIFPMFGKKYELPNKVATYRMLQGDDLVINASTREVTETEGEEIKSFYEKLTGEVAPANLMTSGVFYKDVFMQSEGNTMHYNFDSRKGVASSDDYFTVETKLVRNNTKDHKYMRDVAIKQAIVTFNHSVYGETKVALNNYTNPQMKYGLTARCDDPRGLSGLLAREYKCETMEVSELEETESVEGVVGKNTVLSHFNH